MITPITGCLVRLESQRDSALFNLFQFILTCSVSVRRSGVHRFMSDFKGLHKVTYSSFKFCISRIVVFTFDQAAAARPSLSLLCFCFRIRSSSSAESDSLIALSLKEHRQDIQLLQILKSLVNLKFLTCSQRSKVTKDTFHSKQSPLHQLQLYKPTASVTESL